MKKYAAILLMLIGASACTPDDDYSLKEYEFVGIRTVGLDDISEDGDMLAIPVHYGGRLENGASFTVDYSITGGDFGVNFDLVDETSSSGTLTFAAGETAGARDTIWVRGISDFDTEDDVNLTVTLTNASNGVTLSDYPLKKSFSFSILDDDCDYVFEDFTGPFDCDEPGYGEFVVNLTADPVVENRIHEDNFWDFGGTPYYDIDPVTRTITMPEQVLVMGGTAYIVEGSGAISTCGKSFYVDYTVKSQSDNALIDDNRHTYTKGE